MKIRKLHDWNLSPAEARELQQRLAGQVQKTSEALSPRYVAGVDVAVDKPGNRALAAAVVLSFPELKVVETQTVMGQPEFPYIPGLLSFREAPLILEACERLSITPDLVIVDGQGIAHPRRFGIAAHLGLFLDIPTIGCAKSRLCGSYEEPELEAGGYSELKDDDEVIGAVVRTRDKLKPVFVSIGNKIDLKTAIYWVLKCCRGYRLPEPSRTAHQAATGNLRLAKSVAT